jgi:hypothetical protein
MALPIIQQPIHKITLPILKKEISFRGFTIAEEKIFLTYSEENKEKFNFSSFQNTLEQVLTNCTFGRININTLPLADLEFLLLQIRKVSVGEYIETLHNCAACEHENKIGISLTSDISISENKTVSTLIDITDNIKINMTYPTIDILQTVEKIKSEGDYLKIIRDCCESVIEGESVIYLKDETEESINDFLNSFNKETFASIVNFFNGIPKVSLLKEYDCEKCNHHNKFQVEGLLDFFM